MSKNVISTMHGAATVSVDVVPCVGWEDPSLRSVWAELASKVSFSNALYASPTWFDHLRAVGGELQLLVARSTCGTVVGVVPVLLRTDDLAYDVAGRVFLELRMKVAEILGSEPMIPRDPRLYAQLCGQLLNTAGCRAVYLDCAPTSSDFKRFAAEDAEKYDLLSYFPYGSRLSHQIEFPMQEDDYMGQLKRSVRIDLTRRHKRLAEHCGEVELVRAEDETQVGDFLVAAAKVSENSWQRRVFGSRISDTPEGRLRLISLARRGLLRSYLLKCGHCPCAFVFGYQFEGTYHYVEIGYNSDFKQFSPGMVLYKLLIRDLFDHRRPTFLNFGRGDAEYKRRLGNLSRSEVSVLILKDRLVNQAMITSHSLFRGLVIRLRTAAQLIAKQKAR